jgi:uncharacterized protein
MTTREEAALLRQSAIVTRADRPSQRRCAETAGAPARLITRAAIELRAKADTAKLEFDGYASTYEQPYEMWDYFGPYTEVVTAGAGAVSLARPDLDVPLVLQHQQLRRIARTTNGTLFLSEDDNGLRTLAPELDPTDADVAYIAPKLRSGLIDEMSFAFRIEEGVWSPDYTQYRINRYDIHRGDVAIVGFGANPATSGGLRGLQDLATALRAASDDEARAALAELNARFGELPASVRPRMEELMQFV